MTSNHFYAYLRTPNDFHGPVAPRGEYKVCIGALVRPAGAFSAFTGGISNCQKKVYVFIELEKVLGRKLVKVLTLV